MFNIRPPGTSSLATFARPPGGSYSLPTRDCVPGNTRPPSGRKQELFNVRLPGTTSLATFVRPPGGWNNGEHLQSWPVVSPTQQLGPCPFHAFRRVPASRHWACAGSVRPPGGNMSCSMSAYQGLRPWLRSPALRAEREVYPSSTRDCVPGNDRSPSGRRQSWFLLSTRDCVLERSLALRAGRGRRPGATAHVYPPPPGGRMRLI